MTEPDIKPCVAPDCAALNPYPEASAFRRDPSQVMQLARMGSAHPTRLSFLRVLLRRVREEGWQFTHSTA